MKKSGKCPKCDSTDIIADAKAIDRGYSSSEFEMSVATFRKPNAMIFKEKQTSDVSAWVCASCGYIEYYADHPGALKLPKT